MRQNKPSVGDLRSNRRKLLQRCCSSTFARIDESVRGFVDGQEVGRQMGMNKPVIRPVYFPDLPQRLQEEMWIYDTIFDLGTGYALCLDTCADHGPIVAIVNMTTGEELIRKEI
jgi:hypothetical protein